MPYIGTELFNDIVLLTAVYKQARSYSAFPYNVHTLHNSRCCVISFSSKKVRAQNAKVKKATPHAIVFAAELKGVYVHKEFMHIYFVVPTPCKSDGLVLFTA